MAERLGQVVIYFQKDINLFIRGEFNVFLIYEWSIILIWEGGIDNLYVLTFCCALYKVFGGNIDLSDVSAIPSDPLCKYGNI